MVNPVNSSNIAEPQTYSQTTTKDSRTVSIASAVLESSIHEAYETKLRRGLRVIDQKEIDELSKTLPDNIQFSKDTWRQLTEICSLTVFLDKDYRKLSIYLPFFIKVCGDNKKPELVINSVFNLLVNYSRDEMLKLQGLDFFLRDDIFPFISHQKEWINRLITQQTIPTILDTDKISLKCALRCLEFQNVAFDQDIGLKLMEKLRKQNYPVDDCRNFLQHLSQLGGSEKFTKKFSKAFCRLVNGLHTNDSPALKDTINPMTSLIDRLPDSIRKKFVANYLLKLMESIHTLDGNNCDLLEWMILKLAQYGQEGNNFKELSNLIAKCLSSAYLQNPQTDILPSRLEMFNLFIEKCSHLYGNSKGGVYDVQLPSTILETLISNYSSNKGVFNKCFMLMNSMFLILTEKTNEVDRKSLLNCIFNQYSTVLHLQPLEDCGLNELASIGYAIESFMKQFNSDRVLVKEFGSSFTLTILKWLSITRPEKITFDHIDLFCVTIAEFLSSPYFDNNMLLFFGCIDHYATVVSSKYSIKNLTDSQRQQIRTLCINTLISLCAHTDNKDILWTTALGIFQKLVKLLKDDDKLIITYELEKIADLSKRMQFSRLVKGK